MRVPEPVKLVFDKFPLVTLPAYDNEYSTESRNVGDTPILATYNVDSEGVPMDPKCLAFMGILTLLGHPPMIEVRSPYITSTEMLPVLRIGNKVVTTLDQVLNTYEPSGELVSSPTFKIYRSLVDTWLDDAWHTTIMDPENVQARDIIYGSSTQFPWPFSRIAANQLDDHLEARNQRCKQASGDDYVCSLNNLNRVGMAVTALSDAICTPLTGDPTLTDIIVASYTWPIINVIPESALATIVPPMLRQHAQEVRSFLINANKPRKI